MNLLFKGNEYLINIYKVSLTNLRYLAAFSINQVVRVAYTNSEEPLETHLWLRYFIFKPTNLLLTLTTTVITSIVDHVASYQSSSRWSVRASQLTGFKYSFKVDNSSPYASVLSGLSYVWFSLRYWVVGIILALVAFYFLMYIRLLPFTKIVLEILLIAMFLYWLISGFVFFIKKYQYSKFTSVIQRFWKRAYILFWLLETVVFLIFFYLTLNASEEPVYMYDQMKLYKTHLFSWRWFLIKLLPSVFLILVGYYVLLQLRWGLFLKQTSVLFLLTLVLIYIVWLEFYQFFHIVNWYANFLWVYDYDEFLWTLEIEGRRTRLANNYAALCLMAKFWHLIFIFVFWVFFILRVNEIGRVRYALFSANTQNFVILYIMSWLYMYPWLKFLGRKYLDVSYYWFFSNFRDIGVRVFFSDSYLFFIGFSNWLTTSLCPYSFKNGLFFYWIGSSSSIGYTSFIKHGLLQSMGM